MRSSLEKEWELGAGAESVLLAMRSARLARKCKMVSGLIRLKDNISITLNTYGINMFYACR